MTLLSFRHLESEELIKLRMLKALIEILVEATDVSIDDELKHRQGAVRDDKLIIV